MEYTEIMVSLDSRKADTLVYYAEGEHFRTAIRIRDNLSTSQKKHKMIRLFDIRKSPFGLLLCKGYAYFK